MEIEDEKNVKSDEDRRLLERRKLAAKLLEYAEQGEKEMLELELISIDQSQVANYRDDRGNNVLHIAAQHGRVDCIKFLVDEVRMDVNTRDARGWNPVAVAAFY